MKGPSSRGRPSAVMLFTEGGAPSRYRTGALLALSASGLRVVWTTTEAKGGPHEEMEALGFESFGLGCATSRDYPKAVVALTRLIRDEGIELVHANEPIQGAIGSVASRLARRPCLWHRHHTQIEGRQKRLSRFAGRLSPITMAVSGAAAEAAVRFDKIPERRIRVALNGIPDLRKVEDSEVQRLRSELGIDRTSPVVVLLARMRPEKGHAVLFEAMRVAAPGLSRPAHVVIVGDGPHRGAIERAGKQAAGYQTHLVGHQDDIALWLRLADVVAAPSMSEPFGLSTIEAMAAERPVVASGVEGLREVVVEGETGLLVPAGDAGALAAALTKTLRDPRLRLRLGSGGRSRYLELFTLEKMVERWLGVYRELVPDLRLG